jgi:pyruvate dehydrogenase E1 component
MQGQAAPEQAAEFERLLDATEATPAAGRLDAQELAVLAEVERKIRWLSTWTIHHANHIRENRDGVKVGGHQASCASVSTLMTALYFKILEAEDRVAVKPHASPIYHAIQYLFGNQSRDKLEAFRAFGGAQSYPSRTKDGDIVDFSTGSVGLGAAVTNFAALTQDYLRLKNLWPQGRRPGRMVAIVGDAEMDEGNIYEALLDTWKHDIRNVWWVIDYNRQSLDGVVNEQLFRLIGRFFRAVGWNVITLKYGRKLHDAFKQPGGSALRKWINDCPNDVYSALTFQGGAAWRAQIKLETPGEHDLHALLDRYDDDGLHAVMTNLGGHCMEAIMDAFANVPNDLPTCFICYTIKGYELPLQGHKDNHAGLLNPGQMAAFRSDQGIAEGQEWQPHAGLKVDSGAFDRLVYDAPFNRDRARRKQAPLVQIPEHLPYERAAKASTQEAFGRILHGLARAGGALADRIVTTSPDVAVSTNLGGFVNQRGLFERFVRADEFRERQVPSMQQWVRSPEGQHIELGIAENNLFLNLAALGLSAELFGERLFPIGTLYDPFIARGLDALNYACYMDARFMVVATPSGISLAPEGGAHQSISTPMIGMGQPGLTSFEPSYGDELAEIMRWSFEHMQDRESGGAVYLRLSTRPIAQPEREMDKTLAAQVIAGGYWARPPAEGADMAIVYCGVMAPEALAAHERLADKHSGMGVLAVTSTDRLFNDWQRLERARLDGRDDGAMAHVEDLLEPLAPRARLVSVIDGHPAALAWLGAVRGHAISPLGVNDFGQSGDTIDLYRHYRIDDRAIEAALARFDDKG